MTKRVKLVGAVALLIAVCSSTWIALFLPGDKLVREVGMASMGFYSRYGRFPSSKSELWRELKDSHRAAFDRELRNVSGVVTVTNRAVHLDLGGPFYRMVRLEPPGRPSDGSEMESLFLIPRPGH